MTDLILYLVQVASIFAVLYLLYALTLSRLTFHTLNRLILVVLIPVSILIPLTDSIFPSIPHPIIEVPQLFEKIVLEDNTLLNISQKSTIGSMNTTILVLMLMYWVGVIVCVFRFFFTTRKLILLKQKATIYNRKGFKFAIIDVPEIFSYLNWIFISESKLKLYNPLIIEHEKAHIQLKHSLDLILAELFIAFFWFNPMVYRYRKSLKSVHEFQADHHVLKNQVKTSSYMQLLLQSLEIEKPNNLYSYFNHPIIKKRIDMMTKNKSHKLEKLKYLLLLFVCFLLFAAFIKPTIESTIITSSMDLLKIESLPPSIFPVQNGSVKDITSKYGVINKHPKLKKEKIHGGIDIRAKQGTPIVATANGIIAKAAMEGDWGNLIVISHADGYETWYAHLNGFNSTENQQVKKGEIIGYVGNTGLSTSPHLHYEVKLNGERVDPIDYLKDE